MGDGSKPGLRAQGATVGAGPIRVYMTVKLGHQLGMAAAVGWCESGCHNRFSLSLALFTHAFTEGGTLGLRWLADCMVDFFMHE